MRQKREKERKRDEFGKTHRKHAYIATERVKMGD
jgi:hypothetical protein